ncbi:MAG: prolyl oligopeptidase family serine peptidase [Verrucomicrobiota bacterium]
MIGVSVTASSAEDPFLWLEEVEGESALAWVREENAKSEAALAGTEDFESLQAALLAAYDSPDKLAAVSKIGSHYYNFWRDASQVRGVWRRTTLEEYRQEEPTWEVVLDVDALAEEEGENWVWGGARVLEPEADRAMLQFSRGGGDAKVVREFDLLAKRFVKGGFEIPEAKTNVSWLDRDTLLVGSDFGPGSLTESGYPRVAKRWSRGTLLAEAERVFEGEIGDVSAGVRAWWEDGRRQVMAYRSTSFYTDEVSWQVQGELVRLEKPDDAEVSTFQDQFLFELRSDWQTDQRTFPKGALLAISQEAFLAGDRDFEVLFAPNPRKSLAGFSETKSWLLVNELENVRNRLYAVRLTKEGWERKSLEIPENATVRVWGEDAEESEALWMSVTNYLTPTTLLRSQGVGQPFETLKQAPPRFEAAGFQIHQWEATSADGTQVPYFVVGSESLGQEPRKTLLYAYGGFEIPLLPGYSAGRGIGWLQRGGVYVVANIRGGGEFGPAWHQAALQENRQKAFDDFIAVAEDLIARGVCTSASLAAMGGSNGGLLIGNMLVQRPDLFGALVCAVPLLDMKRYHQLLAGASWVAEYGDPDEEGVWDWLEGYSPYHQLQSEVDYPAILFTTSTRDDRVHPAHARKMVARMKEQGHAPLYYENMEGGHGGAANHQQAAYVDALEYQFLWENLEK